MTSSTLALLVTGLACGGSGGGSAGGGGTPTSPSPSIVFTPDRAAGSPSISLRGGAGSTASVLVLDVAATEVTNVQAVDFILTFPTNLLRFEGFERGDFIGASAQVITGSGVDSLTFQILRSSPSTASGSGVILSLTFSALAGGQGALEFIEPVAEDLFGLEIPGIDWIGGSVRIVT